MSQPGRTIRVTLFEWSAMYLLAFIIFLAITAAAFAEAFWPLLLAVAVLRLLARGRRVPDRGSGRR